VILKAYNGSEDALEGDKKKPDGIYFQ